MNVYYIHIIRDIFNSFSWKYGKKLFDIEMHISNYNVRMLTMDKIICITQCDYNRIEDEHSL